jgi:hypothetical protein
MDDLSVTRRNAGAILAQMTVAHGGLAQTVLRLIVC